MPRTSKRLIFLFVAILLVLVIANFTESLASLSTKQGIEEDIRNAVKFYFTQQYESLKKTHHSIFLVLWMPMIRIQQNG
jgi:hypothetical protein